MTLTEIDENHGRKEKVEKQDDVDGVVELWSEDFENQLVVSLTFVRSIGFF